MQGSTQGEMPNDRPTGRLAIPRQGALRPGTSPLFSGRSTPAAAIRPRAACVVCGGVGISSGHPWLETDADPRKTRLKGQRLVGYDGLDPQRIQEVAPHVGRPFRDRAWVVPPGRAHRNALGGLALTWPRNEGGMQCRRGIALRIEAGCRRIATRPTRRQTGLGRSRIGLPSRETRRLGSVLGIGQRRAGVKDPLPRDERLCRRAARRSAGQLPRCDPESPRRAREWAAVCRSRAEVGRGRPRERSASAWPSGCPWPRRAGAPQ